MCVCVHASAITTVCLLPVLKQTGELLSPGILICSLNVLWQRNWSHLKTNKLDLAAHLQCKACPPWCGIRKRSDSLWQAGRRYGEILWHERGSVVKLGSKREALKGGGKAVCGDWWVSDGFLSAAGSWIWMHFVSYDCRDTELGKKKGNAGKKRELTEKTAGKSRQ